MIKPVNNIYFYQYNLLGILGIKITLNFRGLKMRYRLSYEDSIYDSSYDYTVYDVAFIFQDDDGEEISTNNDSTEEIIEA